MSVRAVVDDGNSVVSGIEAENYDFSISVYGKTIVVKGIAESCTVDVYDLMGNHLYSGKQHRIEMNESGLYLVKANMTTRKVRI